MEFGKQSILFDKFISFKLKIMSKPIEYLRLWQTRCAISGVDEYLFNQCVAKKLEVRN